jgi:hypothetical protein
MIDLLFTNLFSVRINFTLHFIILYGFITCILTILLTFIRIAVDEKLKRWKARRFINRIKKDLLRVNTALLRSRMNRNQRRQIIKDMIDFAGKTAALLIKLEKIQ